MNKNCLLCGVGGQGVVLASKLIAYGAMEKGMFVRTSETIGMAQRGGSVVSHVRMGEEIHSPMIPKGCADVLLAFEPAEAVRNLSYLRRGSKEGIVIVNKKAVQPVTATLGNGGYDSSEMLSYLKEHVKNLYVVDGEAICQKAGSPKTLNVALLGAAAASNGLGLDIKDIECEIERRVKPQYREMNLCALSLGAAALRGSTS
ncbi:pyruvate ferredoxin oxidoreductase [Lachnospiraceae bacterium WCA-9-b2]|uniref:Pyruvate ferredoxin oxidoreductase n=1 Tax=Sporofaciens musculi TaxID=2681861 RepID=A0A7X3SJT5_9FIRM|nr:indolepyruvate oxidoreductase subunit beta [Sporofaciens musculi]MXP76888.1 pyruvate ferredoxin oxidoreductase [Sporofaciens musculi]